MKVYGIPNCNTVKSARAWLDSNAQAYEFVDFKKTPPTPELLGVWCRAFGWENVLNRRGTTWRMLDDKVQKGIKGRKERHRPDAGQTFDHQEAGCGIGEDAANRLR